MNFVVTIINMRAPGMKMMRMPVFTWMTLVVSLLIIFAFPAITVALGQLMFDRLFEQASPQAVDSSFYGNTRSDLWSPGSVHSGSSSHGYCF